MNGMSRANFKRSLASVVIVLSCMAPRLATSQGQSAAPLDSTLANFRRGNTIRVSAGGTSLEGIYLRRIADSLAMTSRSEERRVALATIDSVWVLHHHNAAGAVIGGLLAGAFSAGAVVAFCNSDAGGCGSDVFGVAGLAFVIGGTAGLLVGSGLGWFVQTWRRVYP